MKPNPRRILVTALAAAVFLACIGGPAPAAGEGGDGRSDRQLSGSIIGGLIVFSDGDPGIGCSLTPDCSAWIASNCDATVARSAEPGMFTSFVDTSELSDSLVELSLPRTEDVVVPFGGLTVQFWDTGCSEVDPRRVPEYTNVQMNEAEVFRIPAQAEWMTLASFDLVRVEWVLAPMEEPRGSGGPSSDPSDLSDIVRLRH